MSRGERGRRLAVALAYVTAVVAATSVSAAGASPSVELTAAIPLFAYLHLRARGWWIAGLLAGGVELATRLALGAEPGASLLDTATTALQALIIALLVVRSWGGRHWPSSLHGTVGFGASVVAGTMVGSVLGLGAALFVEHPALALTSFLLGWLEDAIGVAAAVPFLLAWRHLPIPTWKTRRALEATGLVLVWATFVASLAQRPTAGHSEALLLLVPAFAWTAARFDLAWATLANLGLVLFAPELEVVGASSAGWAISQLAFLLLLVLSSLSLAVLLREREQAFRELAASEARMQAVLTSIPEVVLRLDPHGRVLERMGASMLDTRDDGASLTRLGDLLPKEAAIAVEEAAREVLEDGRSREVQASYRAGRRHHTVEARISRLVSGAEASSAMVSIRDVTESRASEQREAEKEKARALRHLTGGVAHDFNNLLTTVIGNLDLLGDTLDDPELRAAHADVARAVTRGRELTRRLLAYSERQPLQPRPVALAEAIPEIASRLRTVSGPRLRLDLSAVEGLDELMASVDLARLEEALGVLVDNARQACPSTGEIRLRVDRRRMSDGPDEPPRSFVRIAVEDDGEGMNLETLGRACDPFFTTRGLGHSGLGLSMVRGFARQSGGHFALSSQVGQGTQASLFLPSHHGLSSSGPRMIDGRVMVIVADVDPDVRRLVARHVMRLGYAPTEVGSAHEVQSVLARTGECALVVIDEDLLAAGDSADVLPAEQRRLVLGLGDAGALEKPFETGALMARLAALLPARPTTPLPDLESTWPPPEDERV